MAATPPSSPFSLPPPSSSSPQQPPTATHGRPPPLTTSVQYHRHRRHTSPPTNPLPSSRRGCVWFCYTRTGVGFQIKATNDKDYSLVFGVYEVGLRRSSYVTGGEPEYPQELFSAVDLLSLQFLVGAYAFQHKTSIIHSLVVMETVADVTLSSSDNVSRKYRFQSFQTHDEVNSSFRSIEVERLTVYEFFVVFSFCYMNFSGTSVPIGIVGICHGSILYLPGAGDNVVEEEDGECIVFLGGNSSQKTKKYRGLNSSDGGNTGDGIKIASGVIGSGDEIESSEELKEMLPDEAGK
ncbi:hypothetical protein Tco_0491984 [Tanacetum coccineum]